MRMVGRVEEVAHLRELARHAATGKGAVVLIESDHTGPITFTPAHGADTSPRELVFDQADEILTEVQRLGAFPTGDDNDNGLGI